MLTVWKEAGKALQATAFAQDSELFRFNSIVSLRDRVPLGAELSLRGEARGYVTAERRDLVTGLVTAIDLEPRREEPPS